ncbi:MAG: hypothetical protein KDE27_03405 [Planctomycetes bacterium]|nr:hypothetical protein [Planctomycetota bacterium]
MASEPHEKPPPLGSWPRLYALVIVLACLMMLLLWSLTAAFNIRMPA